MINFSGGPLQKLRDRLSPGRPPPMTPDDDRKLQEWQDRRAAIIRQFRPAEGEWLRLGALFGLLYCCMGWTAIFLLSVVAQVDIITTGDGWLRAAFLPVLFLIGFYRGRWLGEWSRGEYWSLRAVLVVGLIVIARFLPYVLNSGLLGNDLRDWLPHPLTLFSPPVVINLALYLWLYLGGEGVGRDALNLFARPNEFSVEQGGFNNNDTANWVERQPSYRRLKNRIAMNGFLVALGMAVPFVLSPTAPLDHGQVGPTTALLVLYVPVAILTLSLIRLRYLRTVWRLGELAEPGGLGQRWLVYLVVFGLLLALIALVLPHNNPINTQNTPAQTNQLNQAIDQIKRPTPVQPPTANPQPPSQPLQFPNWLEPLLYSIVFGLALALLVFLLSRVDWKRFLEHPLKIRLRWPHIRVSWTAFVAWLKSLFKRPTWDTTSPEDDGSGKAVRRGWFSRFARDPLPSDPRSQVRYYYRQTLNKAARAGVPRQPPQTPREYATDLTQRFDAIDPAAPEPAQDANQLRSLYEEARFSPHPIAPDQATDAQQQATRLNGALRQLRKTRGQRPENRDQKGSGE